jgi:hypothetical protein
VLLITTVIILYKKKKRYHESIYGPPRISSVPLSGVKLTPKEEEVGAHISAGDSATVLNLWRRSLRTVGCVSGMEPTASPRLTQQVGRVSVFGFDMEALVFGFDMEARSPS